MKPKKLKSLIKKTESSLKWPVSVVHHGDTLEICSDHEERRHIITWPADLKAAGQVRDIEHLHELAHATLCETVHPLFSTSYFENVPPSVLDQIAPAFRACSDWFADAWLMTVAPSAEGPDIDEHYDLVTRTLQEQPLATAELLFGASLIIAEAIHWRKARPSLGGQVKETVDAFLSVPPEKPSVVKYQRLINLLLTPFKYHAELTEDGGAWLVTHHGDSTPDTAKPR